MFWIVFAIFIFATHYIRFRIYRKKLTFGEMVLAFFFWIIVLIFVAYFGSNFGT